MAIRSNYSGKAGVAAVPLTLDSTVSPRVRSAVRLLPAVRGKVPTARTPAELDAQLYGNSSGEVGDVTGNPWAASA
jgi:hypothetical protein